MKRLLVTLVLVVAVGFGCADPSGPKVLDVGWTRYESSEYGFAFGYPSGMELRQREADVQPNDYLGLDAKFFASLTDTVKDVKPTNVAWFYAVPGASAAAFKDALEASNANGAVKVLSSEDVEVNGVRLAKVTSSTEMGKDKVHYLLDRDDTLVIISVFLNEESSWEPVLQTLSGTRD
jgi:hypothetical protein